MSVANNLSILVILERKCHAIHATRVMREKEMTKPGGFPLKADGAVFVQWFVGVLKAGPMSIRIDLDDIVVRIPEYKVILIQHRRIDDLLLARLLALRGSDHGL